MKDKASISHDEVMVKKLRKDRAFAAEYLKAAMEDAEEPQALLVALRNIAECAGAWPKSPRRREWNGKAFTAPCRRAVIRGSPHSSR